jgi:hypothetical protein
MSQVSAEGIRHYLGRSLDVEYIREKSAEVIVVNEQRADTYGIKSEFSQVDEGLNIRSC